MKPMTLLKGFSEIDPQYIRAALENGTVSQTPDINEGAPALPDTLPGKQTVIQTGRKPFRRIYTAAAIAACAVLGVSGMLYLRAARNDSLIQSSDAASEVCEVTKAAETETTPPPQTSLTEQTTVLTTAATTEAPSVTSAADADATGIHFPNQTTEKTHSTAKTTVTSTTAQTTTATETEPALVTYPAQIPAIVCLRDMGGIVQRVTDGLDANVREPVFEVITDAAAIGAYLHPANTNLEPPVTIGTGRKSADVTAAIYANPVLLRVRWNERQDTFLNEQWESYGIQSALLDANGILHLHVAVYNSNQPPAEEEAYWHVYTPDPMLYETSMLCEAGTVPQITGLDFQVQEFKEPNSFSVTEWMNFTSSLSGDLYIANQMLEVRN